MSRLAPVEKFPLAVRKNIRDDWDNVKDDLVSRLSDTLGQPWTIRVNPNQIYAYAKDGFAKECPGSMIAKYIEGALYQLDRYIQHHGEEGKKEINTVCTAHELTIDVDLAKKELYNGCAVTPEGQLAILFNEDNLAVNIDDALDVPKLAAALNEAPTAASSISYVARQSIQEGWDTEAERMQKLYAEILQTEIKLEPKFQDTYETLKASSDAPDHWETNLGNFTKFYFEALASSLKTQKFDSDEMMREAIVEALEKGQVAFRIVPDGQMKAIYNECAFEDGVLFMQTYSKNFGTNIDNVGDGLVDLL